jgi:tetratricopeptide (TPR) repeat protein
LAANAFFVVGSCFLQEPDIAEACFKRGIAAQDLSGTECDFHVANNYVALGDLYSRQHKNELAEQCLQKALDLNQRNYRLNRTASWALVMLAGHCERNKKIAKAIKLEEELLHELETPAVPENQKDFAYIACVHLARLYGQQGNIAQAKQYTDRSLRYHHQ